MTEKDQQTHSASSHQEGGDHYAKMQEDMQPWNVLSHWLTPEEYRGYQKGVAIAYLAREASKGGNMDIRKAIHHLQRLVEEFPQPQETSSPKSLDLPVVELPASMRCGDAINVPPLEVEKPWYPDEGDWIEVSEKCHSLPHGLYLYDSVVVLTRRARLLKAVTPAAVMPERAQRFLWDEDPSSSGRIVAYKVVK